jgi:hypothetical protein
MGPESALCSQVMPRPHPNVTALREVKAWSLRARGWTETRIAVELGVNQSSVSRMLERIEARELARMSASVERTKVVHHAQLDHVIEESLDAWYRSKLPRKRAARKTSGEGDGGGGDEVQTTEVIERDGDTGYLYAAMQAMGAQRSLWGLDVAPALQEPAATVAELAKDVLSKASAYQARAAEGPTGNPAGADRADPPGAAGVPA